MTTEEFTRELPPFTNDPLPLKPPFVFNGVSARVFPLRANLDALQQVCNGYLNIVPEEAGRFRASVPYVYLMVLDYGQIAETVARTGWFAQVEVFFGVPVEWYKLVNGQWAFHDWAIITPYIFVDDDLSVQTGRIVYGFPKVLAKVTKTKSEWVTSPLAPYTLARVETMVFPEAYAGTSLEMKPFLEIVRAQNSSFQFPFDPKSPAAPWTMASNIADAIGGFSRDALWLAQSSRIFPFNPMVLPGVLRDMLSRTTSDLNPFGPGFVQNSLNLKQFRLSDNPSRICYQSLTNGRMRMTSFNHGGLLGEYHTAMGDLSGGHTVMLYEHSSLPVVRTLGLETDRSWVTTENVNLAAVKPVCPFWIDIDIEYEVGENVAWRGDNGVWRTSAGVAFGSESEAKELEEAPTFNATVPSAVAAVAGPFEFSGTTTRVLPLLADRQKLQDFLDSYINRLIVGREDTIQRDDTSAREQIRLSVWARPPISVNTGRPVGGDTAYVYLTACSFSNVASQTNNVGNWVKYELAFMIPVKLQRLMGGEWTTAGVGMVPAYYLVDDCVAAISRFEIQGINASTATFLRPESAWLSEAASPSANPEQTLLRVEAEVLEALGEGQETTMQPIIEISSLDPFAGLDPADAPEAPWRWAEELRLELGAKKAVKAQHPDKLRVGRALALELLGNQIPFTIYTIKQFRDVTDPEKACYQSIVRVARSFKEIVDLREIEDTLVVRIHDFPTLDIVNTLGIRAVRVPGRGPGIVYDAQAIRPFFVAGVIDEPLSERLMARVGGRQWTMVTQAVRSGSDRVPLAFLTLLSDEPGSPVIAVDDEAEKLQDQMDPCRMRAIVSEAGQRLRSGNDDEDRDNPLAIGKASARDALDIVDPQTVIESVLSREWGNADEYSRWRVGRQTLLEAMSALPVDGVLKPVAESVLYRQLNNALADRPGAVASPLPDRAPLAVHAAARLGHSELKMSTAELWRDQLEQIILSQERFTVLRLKMESEVTLLSAFAILGFQGIDDALRRVRKEQPTLVEIYDSGMRMLEVIDEISKLPIRGEPSERDNLDTVIVANLMRLQELLIELPKGLKPEKALGWASDHKEDLRQIVQLARAYCDAQKNALLNKLSRAYQKPDFCIRRDSVGPYANTLLPLSFSWDPQWYYGDEIEYQLHPPHPDVRRAARKTLKKGARTARAKKKAKA
ncbi:MAG TPA: hypothetical protein VKB79_11390 [Bryobacteraceae bacterium]|nr:hypothetical protein [Bryobacteraceae bacterium]